MEKTLANAAFLSGCFGDMEGIEDPYSDTFVDYACHIHAVLIDPEHTGISRDVPATALLWKGIQAAVNYPIPMHCQPVFQAMGLAARFPMRGPLSHVASASPCIKVSRRRRLRGSQRVRYPSRPGQ